MKADTKKILWISTVSLASVAIAWRLSMTRQLVFPGS